MHNSIGERLKQATDSGRVMLICRNFPNSTTAGNLTYLNAFVSFLEAQPIDFRLVVLSERFPNNEFYFRYSDAPHRLKRTVFPRGRRVGNGFVVTEPRPAVKNLARRAVLALPTRVTEAITKHYFGSQGKSAETYFEPMHKIDIDNALEQITDFRPEHLLVDSLILSDIALLTQTKTCKTYLIMHDLVSARIKSLNQFPAEIATESARQTYLKDVEKKEFERLSQFDCLIAIQKQEASFVAEQLPQKSVLYVPMPITPGKRTEKTATNSRKCLFVGSQHSPNIQGMRWFLKEVWPKVIEQLPEASLDVCGTCCAYLSSSAPSVKLHGRVNDLEAFYRLADVCIIPLLAGAGMKIKVVEALSHGVACVTTTIGMQGLEEGAGTAFICTDEAATFAEAVVSLMTDSLQRDALRAKAFNFAEAQLSPEAVFAELNVLIHQPAEAEDATAL